MRTFARILCGKYICRKTSLPVFMWQTKIVNYEYLFVYMTRHIFVACIYLHVCQALCDYNITLKPIFCVESKNICCIIYTSNRICHGKLSNCSCKWSLRCSYNLLCELSSMTIIVSCFSSTYSIIGSTARLKYLSQSILTWTRF